MYSCEQDHTAAAARTALANTGYQPCAARRSLQLAAHHQPGKQAVPPAAAALQPRRGKNKKHGSSRSRPSSSRRSSTTVVATDVDNFRAMVQELTGFPAAAIFRPLPRRVHAASPFAAGGGGAGQGCSGSDRHGHGGSEATNNSTAGGVGSSSPDAPAPLPAMAPPLGVFDFDGLTDLGSPEFDTSWGDLSIEY
ncbi:hypothetical protein PAHAL_1G400700 [Panicum hallii]|jgi:hypothetical protein|uniref:VQ domain-containing protein n=1 Tax=Panicum hallii TaxID=206008 RepID=A0A2S3GTM3_9POAL|nr:uncharacterized protein LOC112876700 [Panicum hallii]PAN08292.1 hypothetical protein PAHAL_1G400700 [Panicum hallii]